MKYYFGYAMFCYYVCSVSLGRVERHSYVWTPQSHPGWIRQLSVWLDPGTAHRVPDGFRDRHPPDPVRQPVPSDGSAKQGFHGSHSAVRLEPDAGHLQ